MVVRAAVKAWVRDLAPALAAAKALERGLAPALGVAATEPETGGGLGMALVQGKAGSRPMCPRSPHTLPGASRNCTD